MGQDVGPDSSLVRNSPVKSALNICRHPLLSTFKNDDPHTASSLKLSLGNLMDMALGVIKLKRLDTIFLCSDDKTTGRVVFEIVLKFLEYIQVITRLGHRLLACR